MHQSQIQFDGFDGQGKHPCKVGIAHTKVIQIEKDTLFCQVFQHISCFLRIFRDHAFCDLDTDMFGGKIIFFQTGFHPFRKTVSHKLLHGHIHRRCLHFQCRMAAHKSTDLIQNEPADFIDQTDLFRHRNKFCGRNQCSVMISQAQQCFHGKKLLFLPAVNRLIIHFKTIFTNRLFHTTDQIFSAIQILTHFCIKVQDTGSFLFLDDFLGILHLFDLFCRIGSILVDDHITDADTHDIFHIPHLPFFLKALINLFAAEMCILQRNKRQQHNKFHTTHTVNCSFPKVIFQIPCHLIKEFIPDSMTEFSVYRTKILQIYRHKLQFLPFMQSCTHICHTGSSVFQFCYGILFDPVCLADDKKDQICHSTDDTIHHNISVSQLNRQKNNNCNGQHLDQSCHGRTDIFSVSEIADNQHTQFDGKADIPDRIKRATAVYPVFDGKQALCPDICQCQDHNNTEEKSNDGIRNFAAFSLRHMLKHQVKQENRQNGHIRHNGRIIQPVQEKAHAVGNLPQCYNGKDIYQNGKHRKPHTGNKPLLFDIQVHVLFIIKEQQHAVNDQRNIFYF